MPSLRAACLLFAGLCLLLPGSVLASFTFSVPAARIQGALLPFFPLREYAIDARLTLSEPTVLLRQGASELRLDVPLVASISGQGRLRGTATVAVGLHYKSMTGELFLGIPRAWRLEMAGLSEARREAFDLSLGDLLTKTLPLVRIYRVREQDLNHSLAKSEIKAMRIDDGILRVTIGFD